MSPCDFLLHALSKNIHREVPELEESIHEVFKSFIKKKEPSFESDVQEITPMMALALKLETNLSQRQYVTLASKKVLGKLPYIKKVRRAADQLDPGNVTYQVVSKFTGEIIREHRGVPRSGLINADDDLGNMCFGDLNINVHGYRSYLADTIAKLVEELKFPKE